MDFLNNIQKEELKYLTHLIFKKVKNYYKVGDNKYIIIPDNITKR